MDFELSMLLMLLAAFGGGLFGAAIGALPAFVFAGICALIGVAAGLAGSEVDLISDVAFGPVFGPHISFAGAVAAAAFAARGGKLASGKDIAAPLAGLGDPLPLLVGGLFGAGGYVVQQLLAALLVVDSATFYTDTVALTIVISAIVARLAFGKTSLFGSLDAEARGRGRFRPGGERVWLGYQEGFLQATVVGVGVGVLSAWLVTRFFEVNPDYIALAGLLAFGISASSLIFLQFGFSVPVTHHMTLPAAAAAAGVLLAGGAPIVAVVAGVAAAVAGALLGEFFSRLFLIHGDTHIDPPANAIWVMATVVVMIRLIFGPI